MKTRAVLMTTMLLVAVVAPGLAAERVLMLSPEKTEITFSLEATGENVLGHLSLSEGEIRFDPETGIASGKVVVDALHADTGNKKRDKKMHKKVLESESYPLIEFTPTSIEGVVATDGPSDPVLHGNVRLLGQDHTLDLQAHVEADGQTLSFETDFEIPFVDWGLHDPSFLVLRVAKVVTVSIDAEGLLRGGALDAEPAGRR